MPRGVAQHYIDHPEYLTCWCGKVFQRKSLKHKQCSAYHRKLASIVRNLVPRSLARNVADSRVAPVPTPVPAPAPTLSPIPADPTTHELAEGYIANAEQAKDLCGEFDHVDPTTDSPVDV